MHSEEKRKLIHEIWLLLIKTGVILLAAVLLFTCLLAVKRQSGNSMSPFVRDGDLCIFYRLEQPYLNDVVLYEDPDGETKIGRIVATGSQIIEFSEEGGFFVDGSMPSEEIPYETWLPGESEVHFPLELSGEEVFVLNDFRGLTTDSRESGPIKRDKIKGKLFFQFRRRNF